MKKLIAMEEFAQFIFVLWAMYQLPSSFSTLSLFLIFFTPDLFAIGYLINRKVGAILYNFSHHKLVALAFHSPSESLEEDSDDSKPQTTHFINPCDEQSQSCQPHPVHKSLNQNLDTFKKS